MHSSRRQNLFHLSEEAAIERFVPRPSALTSEPAVWAIDDARLRNYLVQKGRQKDGRTARSSC